MRAPPAGAGRAAGRLGPVLAAALLVATAGCADSSSGGSANDEETTTDFTPATEPESSPSPAATVNAVDGEDAASALTDFACSPAVGVSDRWTATGTLANEASAAATYRVTVVVVSSTGIAGAESEQVVEVPAKETAELDMGRVRGPLDGTCQVQVLRVG